MLSTKPMSDVRARLPAYAGFAAYLTLLVLVIPRHEPWADEAHSWLLARDATLSELWTRLLHYEGTPGLWHTVLHALNRAGMPYDGMNVISGLFAACGAWLLFRHSKFPLGIRLALPFTFFLGYQYAVVARSYALLPMLLFGCAMVWDSLPRRLPVFTALLCMLAAVSAHGVLLAGTLWVAAHITILRNWRTLNGPDRKRVVLSSVVFGILVALMVVATTPASDVTFPRNDDFSLNHYFQVTTISLCQAFTGEWISSIAVLALSISFFWRAKVMLAFVLPCLALCIFASLVYTQVWHFGVIFLAWLFAFWIAAGRITMTVAPIFAMLVVIAIQGYWTMRSISYDWSQPYSGSREAAKFVGSNHLERSGIGCVGFSCVAVQPYFSNNLFVNYQKSDAPAYWDWSPRNHVNDWSAAISSRPGYMLAGYKTQAERADWARKALASGYELSQHFEGNVYWRTRVFEPEAFDLYRLKVGSAIDIRAGE